MSDVKALYAFYGVDELQQQEILESYLQLQQIVPGFLEFAEQEIKKPEEHRIITRQEHLPPGDTITLNRAGEVILKSLCFPAGAIIVLTGKITDEGEVMLSSYIGVSMGLLPSDDVLYVASHGDPYPIRAAAILWPEMFVRF